jgi:Ribonuclease G/E
VKRALYLDKAIGETRGVVTLDGRPERLLIERADDLAIQRLGAIVVARVRRVDRGLSTLFLDLGGGPDAVLPLNAAQGLAEGAAIEIEITAESHAEKGSSVRLIGLAEGPPRLIRAALAPEARLAGFAPGLAIVTGDRAREAADIAEAQVLAIEHPLPGGGSIAIEPTRALVAVDVDVGAAGGGDARRRARAVNMAAIDQAARLLRLKALSGLIAIDLVGAGHDGVAIAAAAKAAFAPDDPGVSIGPVSRFGLLQLATPRRWRPVTETLCGPGGGPLPTPLTVALRLLRALEREGRADGGARLVAACAPGVAAALSPYMGELTGRLGGRVEILTNDKSDPDRFEVTAR